MDHPATPAPPDRTPAAAARSARLETLGHLALGVAHDFNNVLTTIVLHAERALSRCNDSPGLRTDLAEIRRAGERAAALTRRILAFGRDGRADPTLVDMRALVVGAASMLRRLLPETIRLAIEALPAAGHLRADPQQIEHVLMNLVLNARDAMPAGGRITVRTGPTQTAPGGGKAGVELLVLDQGTGVSPELRERIFEPFFTTKAAGHGSGLGLSLVRSIVTEAGGRVTVDSEPGRGSTFRVVLPVVEVRATPETAGRGASATDASAPATILVVEDDLPILGLVRSLLQESGHSVIAARGVEEALAVTGSRGPVDLVVSDVMLPDGSGPEVIENLRERWPALRALFVSGFDYPGLPAASSAGVEPLFLQKPFTPDQFQDAVARALRQPALDAVPAAAGL